MPSPVRLQEALLFSRGLPKPTGSLAFLTYSHGIPGAFQAPWGPLSQVIPRLTPSGGCLLLLKQPRSAVQACDLHPQRIRAHTHAPLLKHPHSSSCSRLTPLTVPPGKPLSASFCSPLPGTALQTTVNHLPASDLQSMSPSCKFKSHEFIPHPSN